MKDIKRTSHIPGEPGIWVMIWGDLAIFALLFGTFAFYRREAVDLFNQAQSTLGQPIGIINTLILLTSSWLVARAVRDMRDNRRVNAGRALLFALICAAAFLVNKGIEWAELISEGYTLQTNDFYMFFYMLTGIHGLHVVIGMGVLLYMYLRTRNTGEVKIGDMGAIESGASFWHLVDLLWIVLFALLYVAR
ncbi:cytochrome c oxidase subunit 3 [Agrobacterium radiobacter]|uniref:cytochrome c oxidase subunit 3 n=1 Tax=Agrobacterium radiobacter TaxID=362 RepID=UPI003F8246E4